MICLLTLHHIKSGIFSIEISACAISLRKRYQNKSTCTAFLTSCEQPNTTRASARRANECLWPLGRMNQPCSVTLRSSAVTRFKSPHLPTEQRAQPAYTFSFPWSNVVHKRAARIWRLKPQGNRPSALRTPSVCELRQPTPVERNAQRVPPSGPFSSLPSTILRWNGVLHKMLTDW